MPVKNITLLTASSAEGKNPFQREGEILHRHD